MSEYRIADIEARWQKEWEDSGLYDTPENPTDKFYLLEMFAYPSGDLHMGHFRNYTVGDAVWRFQRMQGKDVLHPFGWDAFGMPAEQAAIKRKLNPGEWTLKNIETSKATMKKMSISYDWNREFATCLPDYYKWTQWVFLQLHKAGLTYRSTSKVNWCETCHTILANEQVINGECWRCKNAVEQKEIEGCWFFKYSEYAEKLLAGLDELTAWPAPTVNAQKEWIGKSTGAEIEFQLDGREEKLRVFTTRPDTLYGVTFMAIAPEHPLTLELAKGTEQEEAVQAYVKKSAQKSDRERTVTSAKEKDGVFSGAYAVHPMTGEKIPLWVADYVLASYGSGAVMAVPAHDERDFAFARKYELPIRTVICPTGGEPANPDEMDDAYAAYGVMCNSDSFDGLPSKDGIKAVIDRLESDDLGNGTTQYKLRDWLVSRQRYWGCPIPIIHCDDCGAVPVPDEQLPVELPEDDVDLLSPGRSPLADVPAFMNVKCPSCGNDAQRDPDTMDTFMCSSWYQLRFTDANNKDEAFSKEAVNQWMPIDLYIGGDEHRTGHLLYFRFITRVLHEQGFLDNPEPCKRLFHHGMVADDVGEIMSKSLGNTVSPMDMMQQYGIDSSRMAMFFFAPSDHQINWNEGGVLSQKKFLTRTFDMVHQNREAIKAVPVGTAVDTGSLSESAQTAYRKAHQVLARANEAYREDLAINTLIARSMEWVTLLQKHGSMVDAEGNDAAALAANYRILIQVLAPVAPHMAEELWEATGGTGSIFTNGWPEYDADAAKEDTIEIVVQINGKVKHKLQIAADADAPTLQAAALAEDAVQEALDGREPKKVIAVPGRLVNIVV